MISLIASMDKNQVIGCKNELLWHIPNDLKHFRDLTIRKPVIMGSKTFRSIGLPLKKRLNLVLSRDLSLTLPFINVQVLSSLNQVLSITKEYSESVVIGGGEIYRLFLPYVQRMYLTLINGEFVGDACFPAYDANEWIETARETFSYDNDSLYKYAFVTLDRK